MASELHDVMGDILDGMVLKDECLIYKPTRNQYRSFEHQLLETGGYYERLFASNWSNVTMNSEEDIHVKRIIFNDHPTSSNDYKTNFRTLRMRSK